MKQLNIATESIAFQTGSFFKELTSHVKELRALEIVKSEDIEKTCVRIDQCIYKHTGISATTKLWQGSDNAIVMVPTLARGNVLNRAEYNKYLTKNFDATNLSFFNLEKKGWIDPANSRVGGAFSEIIFRIYVGDMFLLKKSFTPEEAAAVILHEVGHAYTFLQFMVDTIVVNTVLQRTYQELLSVSVDKTVKIILTKAADDMQIKNREWLEAVHDGANGDIAFKLLVSAVAIEPRNMDNKRYFTSDSAEELADIFATRHGAGLALITVGTKFSSYPTQTYGILYGIALAMSTACCAIIAPGALFFTALGSIMAISGAVEASKEDDVTSFKQASKKIRNQFVEKLKLVKLPKEEIAEIIESIDLADKIIQGYSGSGLDQRAAVKFFDMFRRGKMEARASREYTDKLEGMAANDLFIRSAQLGSR
jgi:hypothetical protein